MSNDPGVPVTELPPDVRDRAARAAWERANGTDGPFGWADLAEDERKAWRDGVDAVAEVLAVPFQEAVRRNALNAATVVDVMADRDALQAKVDQLDAENVKLRIEVTNLEGELEDEQEQFDQLISDIGGVSPG